MSPNEEPVGVPADPVEPAGSKSPPAESPPPPAASPVAEPPPPAPVSAESPPPASPARRPRPAAEEDEPEPRNVPVWCGWAFEIFILLAVTAAVLLSPVLTETGTRWTLGILVGAAVVPWLLHWVFLRRVAFLDIWPVWLVVVPAIVAWSLWRPVEAGDGWQLAIGGGAVILLLGSAYTESQITRLLAWLGAMVSGLALLMVRVQTSGPGSVPVYGELLTSGGPGPISNTAGGTILAAAGVMGLAIAGFRMLAVATPLNTSRTAPHSRTRLFSSPGLNQALIAGIGIAVIMLWLNAFESLLALPLMAAALVVFLVLMTAKQLLWWPLGVFLVAVVLVVAAASLGRPRDARFGSPVVAVVAHAKYLGRGMDYRLDTAQVKALMDAEKAGVPMSLPEPPATTRLPRWPDVVAVVKAPPFGLHVLFLAAYAIILLYGLWYLWSAKGARAALIGGALPTALLIPAYLAVGRMIPSPALLLLAAVFLTIVAVGGDFEEDVEVD